MAHVIRMPQAGQSMTEGRIISWLKSEGESVQRGEPLMEIETDKANLEVEALEDGVLRKVFVPEGELCPVLAPVGVLGKADEEIDFEELRRAAAPAAASPEPDSGTGVPESIPSPAAAPGIAERAAAAPRPAPAAPAAPATSAAGKAPLRRAPTSASPAFLVPPASGLRDGRGRPVIASPLARKLAQERGVPLALVRGSGPGGRILRRDVQAADVGGALATDGRGAAAYPLPSLGRPYPPPAPRPPARVPFEGMRKAIASVLTQSASRIPHFYTRVGVDMTHALALKEALAGVDVRVSVNDLIIRAVTLALRDEPRVNCRVFDDHIEYPEDIHIGIAVGDEEGLVVPVLLGAQSRDLAGIAAATRELIASAQQGKLIGSGQGTFTISNLGMFGVDSFTAIINPPEGAILAIGATREQLVPAAGGFFPRSVMEVTLSSDHRAIDGFLAARFLSRLRYFLETASEL